MLTLACVVLFAAIAGAVQAADAVECRPSMNVGPADRTCVARRVCLLQSAPGELVLDDDASHVPAGLLDVPLAHVGSYATSPSLKLRFALAQRLFCQRCLRAGGFGLAQILAELF